MSGIDILHTLRAVLLFLIELNPVLKDMPETFAYSEKIQKWGNFLQKVLFLLQKWLPRIAPVWFMGDTQTPDYEPGIDTVMDQKAESAKAQSEFVENLQKLYGDGHRNVTNAKNLLNHLKKEFPDD